MTTMDETKLNAEMTVEPKEDVQAQSNAPEKKLNWKEVTIGGVSGIVLGAAATAGIEAIAHGSDSDAHSTGKADIPEIGENVEVAENVNDDMTFSEAFAEARHEVGAGGVFVWHEQVYGTYYKEEWDAMTDEQKADYWAAVRGTDIVEEPDAETEAEVDAPVDDIPADEAENEIDEMETEEAVEDEVEVDEAEVEAASEEFVEPELVAAGETADGGYAELYDTTGDGQGDVAVIDVDNDSQADIVAVDADGDGQADIMAADANGDGVVDESEVFQITDEGVVGMDEVDNSADDMIEPTCSI